VRPYLALFRARCRVLLQYRAAAVAGFGTQLLFGLVKMMVLEAFYTHARVEAPLSLAHAISYTWLAQAFFHLLPFSANPDPEVRDMVRSGHVAYELTRPIDLHGLWWARALASRTAPTLMRAVPMILVAVPFLGLEPPASPASALAFVVTILAVARRWIALARTETDAEADAETDDDDAGGDTGPHPDPPRAAALALGAVVGAGLRGDDVGRRGRRRLAIARLADRLRRRVRRFDPRLARELQLGDDAFDLFGVRRIGPIAQIGSVAAERVGVMAELALTLRDVEQEDRLLVEHVSALEAGERGFVFAEIVVALGLGVGGARAGAVVGLPDGRCRQRQE